VWVVIPFGIVARPDPSEVTKLVDTVLAASADFTWWGNAVMSAFQLPSVARHVHSLRFRLKSADRIQKKIESKLGKGEKLTPENIFEAVADFAGVRVLHLRVNDIAPIHKFIGATEKWQVVEEPFAIVGDDRFLKLYASLGIKIQEGKGRYSSVHCAVGHKNLRCEVQVRTLWEEIWGEVSHAFYEQPAIPEIYSRNLDGLSRLCVLGSAIVEDLDHLVAREQGNAQLLNAVTIERDKMKSEADDAKRKVEALTAELKRVEKERAGAPATVLSLSTATGLARDLGASLDSLSVMAGTKLPANYTLMSAGQIAWNDPNTRVVSSDALRVDGQVSRVMLSNDSRLLVSGASTTAGTCTVCHQFTTDFASCSACRRPICRHHLGGVAPQACGSCGATVASPGF
jgi:putative GTP pyrophosphokinase